LFYRLGWKFCVLFYRLGWT